MEYNDGMSGNILINGDDVYIPMTKTPFIKQENVKCHGVAGHGFISIDEAIYLAPEDEKADFINLKRHILGGVELEQVNNGN
jgi:hypothetical protein